MAIKESLLLYFRDINYAYNDCARLDALEKGLSELEEVVRCKDCKYYRQNKPYLVAGVPIMANLVCEKWADGCRTDPDGFCFMGERKEDE